MDGLTSVIDIDVTPTGDLTAANLFLGLLSGSAEHLQHAFHNLDLLNELPLRVIVHPVNALATLPGDSRHQARRESLTPGRPPQSCESLMV